MRQDRAQHHRRKPAAGQLLSGDRDEHALDFEIAVNTERAPDPQHGDARQVERPDVVERPGHQQAVVLAEAERNHVIDALPVEIIVGVDDALRPVGRAGSVHQAEQIIRLANLHGRRRIFSRKRGGVGLRRVVEQDRGRQIGNSRGEFRVGEHELRAGVGRDVFHLVGGEAEIDRQKHRAEMTGGKRKLEKGRAVLHHHGDDVVGADSLRRKVTGGPLDAPR